MHEHAVFVDMQLILEISEIRLRVFLKNSEFFLEKCLKKFLARLNKSY
jgi:hypothetical protein